VNTPNPFKEAKTEAMKDINNDRAWANTHKWWLVAIAVAFIFGFILAKAL
jgi:hypothetical protein